MGFACFDGEPDELAIVIAFDPGGTTGYCVMGVTPEAIAGGGIEGKDLRECLSYIDYGQIDCGSRHGQTGVGMTRGHDGLNISGEYAGIAQMLNIIESFDNPVVVIEDFVLDVHKANRGRDLLTPVRIIAGLSTLMQYSFGKDCMDWVFIQNRSLAKTTCTDERLKNWNLYDGASGPHARDATRHAFYFLRSSRGFGPDAAYRRHLGWPHLFDDPANMEIYHNVKQKGSEKGFKKSSGRPLGERIPGLG